MCIFWTLVLFLLPGSAFGMLGEQVEDLTSFSLEPQESTSFFPQSRAQRYGVQWRARTQKIDAATSVTQYVNTRNKSIFALRWEGTAHIDLAKYFGDYQSDFDSHNAKREQGVRKSSKDVLGDHLVVHMERRGRIMLYQALVKTLAPEGFEFNQLDESILPLGAKRRQHAP
jgi:hypothetical protein